MNVEKFALPRDEAHAKWISYVAACKTNPSSINDDMKKVYNQLKCGRKIINIYNVMKRGGVTHDFKPKLAIGQATESMVYCRYSQDGTVRYGHEEYKYRNTTKRDVRINNCFPELPEEYGYHRWLQCPIPVIPADLQPKKLTKDYYILWEVESWTPAPDRDPYLLRRITPNMFVIVAAWDLTDFEIAVMAGRVS